MSEADEVLKAYGGDLSIPFIIGIDRGEPRYADVPVYAVMERVVKIVDKEGNQVRFRLNREQTEVYRQICLQRRAGKPVRIDILKARQMGMSTFIAALFSVICFFGTNVRVGIIADTKGHAGELFEKYKYIYDHLDDDNPFRDGEGKIYEGFSFKPKLKWSQNQNSMATLYGNSSIDVMAAGDTAGRSMSFQYLHLSEVAYWEKLFKTLVSVLQTVSRKNLNSMVFMETTANGFNEYKKRWDRDCTGVSPYKALFFPWYEHPEYQERVPDGFDFGRNLEDWELKKMEEHGLSRERMYWYHMQYMEIQSKDSGGKDTMLQEYPFTPVDAFIVSGNSVFDSDLLAKRKEEILLRDMDRAHYESGVFTYRKKYSEDGGSISVENIRFVPKLNGPIRVYEKPLPGEPYVAVCDPNLNGSDDAAIQVIDNTNGRQVAVFQSKEYQPDEVACFLYCLAKTYNGALVSSEMNLAQSVMDFILKTGYENVYMQQNQEYSDALGRVKLAYGHKTTVANRNFMIDQFRIAFRQDPSMIVDYNTVCEMEEFQLVEKRDRNGNVVSAKQEAVGGAHDDLVMAYAAFYVVRNQQSAAKAQTGDGKEGEALTEAGWEKHLQEVYKRDEREGKGKFGIVW